MIPNEAINEFKEIFKRHYNIELSDQEANEKAVKVLGLFKVIYKPIPKQNIDNKDVTEPLCDAQTKPGTR